MARIPASLASFTGLDMVDHARHDRRAAVAMARIDGADQQLVEYAGISFGEGAFDNSAPRLLKQILRTSNSLLK